MLFNKFNHELDIFLILEKKNHFFISEIWINQSALLLSSINKFGQLTTTTFGVESWDNQLEIT
jgi:hypothetical protein